MTLGERRSVKLLVVHVTHMLCLFLMTMIVFDDMIKECCECCVRFMRSCVDTYPRVCVLSSREDSLLEREAMLVVRVMKLLPDLSCQVLTQKRLGTLRKYWEAN